MALIEWSEEYSVGIESLDEQHQNLVNIINKLDEARKRGKGSKIMNQVLNEIIGYTQEHFSFEENMMKEADYPDLKLHRNQHRQLLQKIERFQFEFLNEKNRISAEMGEFFSYWLTSHILKHDKDYMECLRNEMVGS